MREITFDIETRNLFQDVGKNDPALLDISIVGAHDSETDTYETYTQEELPKLWSLIEEADVLVGYNSDHFDIPLLNKYYPGDLTLIKSIDLMKSMQEVLGHRVRLDDVANATLGAQKNADGLQAYRWWKEGNVDAIREYCIQDVKITRELYEYAKANNVLKYLDRGTIRDVNIDTSDWKTNGDAPAMTRTLNF